jgi:aminoglycoside phosphotransferase (APT) family kinase protein
MPITNEYIGRSIPGLPSTSEIVAICRQNGFSNNGMKYPRNGSPIAYIKYGPRYGIPEGEMPTQLYVYNVFKKMSAGGVKVPEIYHAFEQLDDKVNGPVTYIIMEYVHGQTVEAAIKNCSQQGQKTHIFDQVAKAVDQLLQVPPPNGLRLGPARGGLINHPLFADNKAAKVYDSVGQLQRHFNKVIALPLKIPCMFNTRSRHCAYTFHTIGAQEDRIREDCRLFQR